MAKPAAIHELNEDILKPIASFRQKADEFLREQVLGARNLFNWDAPGSSKMEDIAFGMWATQNFINGLFRAVEDVERIFFLPIPQSVKDTQRVIGECIARAAADYMIDHLMEEYGIAKSDIHVHNLVAHVVDVEYLIEVHIDLQLKHPAFDFEGRVLLRVDFALDYDLWEDDNFLNRLLSKLESDIDQLLSQYPRGDQRSESNHPARSA